jgi:hypothetical protein
MTKRVALESLAVAALLLAISPAPLRAQQQQSQKSQEAQQSQEQAKPKSDAQQPPSAPAPPPARPADVASPDAILAACYDVISGPAGQKRDWDRFKSLFVPGARLIPTQAKKDGPGFTIFVATPDQYAAFADAYFQKNAFAEKEIARKSERYGAIMHIFSTYESRHDPKDEKPFERGINSFQLFYDGSRWWIVTIYWMGETPDAPIPAEFLPAAH